MQQQVNQQSLASLKLPEGELNLLPKISKAALIALGLLFQEKFSALKGFNNYKGYGKYL
jgi:hypothetical protein